MARKLKNSFIKFVCGLAITLASTTAMATNAPDITGHWKGAIELPGNELAFDIDFKQKDGEWTADISIPAQGAANVPLVNIVINEGQIIFEMPGVPGDPKFSGKITDDGKKISGEFSQSGHTVPFAITLGDDKIADAIEALKDFDQFVNQALTDWNVPGFSIGIVVDDEVVFAQGFGYRDLDKRYPVTPKTLFAIGSSTKAFTTFLLGLMVDDGKMEWNTPVNQYLPEFRMFDDFATNHVVPRDLVTHRTGLPRHDLMWYNSSFTRKEMVERLRFLQPSKQIREKFQYNNLMFMTAGYLGGRLSGSTWEQAVKQRIFKPLGMNSSNFSVDDSQKNEDFSLPYEEKDDEIRLMSFRNIDNVGPAGSINSNIEEMTNWVRMHLNKGKFNGKQIISEDVLKDLHTPQMAIAAMPKDSEFSPRSYAMGWMVDTYLGHYRVSHGGAIDGFIASVTLYPHDGVGIVAFANKNGTAMTEYMARHAADLVLGNPSRDWNGEALERHAKGKKEQKEAEKKKNLVRKSDTSPSHTLEEYAGDYEHPGYGILKIAVNNDQLEMTYNNIPTSMEHWHFEVFSGLENPDDRVFEDHKIRFLTNMKGNVEAIATPFEPSVDDIIFTKKSESKLSDPQYLAKFLGKFELAGQTITVGLKGNVLTLVVPGQPIYELEPDQDDEFNLKGISGFSVKFVKDDSGKYFARFNQPNGVFDTKRVEE